MKLVLRTGPGDFSLAAGMLEALRVVITHEVKMNPGDIIFMQSPGGYRQKCSGTEVLPGFKHVSLSAKVVPIADMFGVVIDPGEIPISAKQNGQIRWILSKNFEHLFYRSADNGWKDVFPLNLRSKWMEAVHDEKRLELAGMYHDRSTD